MDGLYLIVTIGGQRVALSSSTVESVVEIDEITPVPCSASHIAGLSALRSRVLTMIDSLKSLGIGECRLAAECHTVIVTVDAQQYGLLVDDVVDVVPIGLPPRPPPLALTGGWARAVRAVVEHDGETLPLLDLPAIIAGPATAAA